jgi:leucyl aminopeptidase
MQVNVVQGAIQETGAELIVVNLFQGVAEPGGATAAVDRALGGAISERIQSGDFDGRLGQMALLYTRGAIPAPRVLVVGLGKREAWSADRLRQAAAMLARQVRELGVTRYASVVHGAGAGGLAPQEAAQALVEGTLLGGYRFEAARQPDPDRRPPLEELTLVEWSGEALAAVEHGAQAGRIIGEAACYARDLVNRPGNELTPTLLAQAAQEMAGQVGLACRVLDEDEMAAEGMGALLAVAQGSREPARFIVLEHKGADGSAPPYVIIGKGITFDSGGISLKPVEGMQQMKYDMAGAAAALATMRAVAELDLPLRVIGLAPATENLPGGRAYKPGDVLRSKAGLTIEVISTDAEGRLILADALAYAGRYAPRAVVDLATLTGGCVVALGHVAAGLMGNDQPLAETLAEAAERSGEKVWQLPLFDEYGEQIKSDVADIKNAGGREASAITAAKFLARFAEGYPWAHLDIAGTAWSGETKGYMAKGATGYGVRLLTAWLRTMGEPIEE